MSDLRWTGPGGVVHVVWEDPFRPLSLCGAHHFPQEETWEIKPGDSHVICITCDKCRREQQLEAAGKGGLK